MTVKLPPALRRTRAADDGLGPRERLTFKREDAARLGDLDGGALVALPNHETFTVDGLTTDLTHRPVLVVRRADHHRKGEAMTAPATTTLTEVEIRVDGLRDDLGSLPLAVLELPEPLEVEEPKTSNHGLSESAWRLTFSEADFDTVVARARNGKALFVLPGKRRAPDVLRVEHARRPDLDSYLYGFVVELRQVPFDHVRGHAVSRFRAEETERERARVKAEAEDREARRLRANTDQVRKLRQRQAEDAPHREALEQAWEQLSHEARRSFLMREVDRLDPLERAPVLNHSLRGLT